MKRLLLILAAFVSLALSAGAQEPISSTFGLSPTDEAAVKKMQHRMDSIRRHRPTVALVLSGGGAKGAATVGALQYLKKYEIPIDIVAGTSIGGLLGALYAMGYDEDYMERLVKNMDWNYALSDKVDKKYIPYSRIKYKEKYLLSIPFFYRQDDYRRYMKQEADYSDGLQRKLDLGASQEDVRRNFLSSLPSGFVYGQNVNQIITSRTVGYSDSTDFFDFPIPFLCVATDMVSGKAKVWHDGSINLAMRSTMSIPGLFVPVRTQGMVLVDGGMRNNYPANLVKKLGADIVIGIDLSNENLQMDQIQNLGNIISQSMDLFSNDARDFNLPLVDVSIHPNLEGYNMLSFTKAAVDSMFVRGYEAAAAMAPKLDSLREVIGNEKFKLRNKPAVDVGEEPVVIDKIKILGVPSMEAEYILSRMYVKPKSIVNKRVIEEDVAKIYGRGAYDYVNYELHGKEEPYELRIICKRGPMHQFGLGARLDSDNLVSILLNLGLNTNAMSGHSLDFVSRISTDPYASLHYAYNAPVFAAINVKASVRYTDRTRFLSGTNKYSISFLEGTQDLFISNIRMSHMDVKVGLRNRFYNVSSIMASEVVGDYNSVLGFKDYPSAFVDGRYESLDSGYFPTKGISTGFRFDLISRVFYPNESGLFAAFSSDVKLPLTVDRFTFIPQGNIRLLFGDNIPIHYANVIGGDMVGQYIDQQIPFVGLDNAAFRRNNILVARMDVRMRMWKNHYVSMLGNLCYDFVNFQSLMNGELVAGLGASYAYNSVFGPLKLQIHWNTLTAKFGVYLSMGYQF